MRSLTWFCFLANGLVGIIYLCRLGRGGYPRASAPQDAFDDALSMLVYVCLCFWGAWVLFHP